MSIPPLLAGSLLAALLIADAGAAEYTAEAYKTAVGPCMRARDYDCAEKNWMQYLRLRPNDGNALANLGIVRNLRDDHKGAVVAFERAIDLGEGTYDLFSYYADSLAKLGRTDDAINWSYKALAVVPKLVDVRGNLAKLLVLQKRYYEALSLLESFDADLQAKGQQPYFEGQRISIETALSRNEPAPSERAALRHLQGLRAAAGPIGAVEIRSQVVEGAGRRIPLAGAAALKQPAETSTPQGGVHRGASSRVQGNLFTTDLASPGSPCRESPWGVTVVTPHAFSYRSAAKIVLRYAKQSFLAPPITGA